MVSESVGLFDGLEEANSKVLARSPSAPDEPMHHQMKRQKNCVRELQRLSDVGAPDEPMAVKSKHRLIRWYTFQ
jgi:hypothetical protein